MSYINRFLNNICKLLYKKEYKNFIKACDMEKIQNDYLLNLIARNSNTEYGRKYKFETIHNYTDFADKVPLTIYDDYIPYIDKISNGEKNILTVENVRVFELTSGSSSGKKLIPYTNTLKNEFQKGIKSWLFDIYDNVGGVCNGKSYWSITPVTTQKTFTTCGIPIGFEEDSEYFGKIEKNIMDKIFAVDSSVKFSSDMTDFYMRTSKQLLTCNNLTLISIWNPTYLTILCDFIRENVHELTKDFNNKRKNIIINSINKDRFDLVFPNLKIISCWADGSAADYIADIERLFPNVYIEPKGILATECFISFPLVNETGSRLSINSHFFEFRNLSDGKIYLSHQLSKGEYEVIVTTGGGFYRYCIGDIIEVLETFPNHPPLIKFLRRKGITSDLFGEKLTEEFIKNIAESVGIHNSFYLLAPDKNRYCLYTQYMNITDDMLDNALRKSFHYNYCRDLGQLQKAKVILVGGNPEQDYINRLIADGLRLGDIKPCHLSNKDEWNNWFTKEDFE